MNPIRDQKNSVRLTALVLVVAALLLAACSPSATAAPTNTAAPAPTAISATKAGSGQVVIQTINVANNSTYGNFLVDAKGLTLYIYTKDTAGVSNCSGGCAANWPPLASTGAPSAGKGVDGSKLGTITRADGSKQVTYNNKPLYYYIGDNNPGDTTGQGVGSVWYVLAP